MSTNISVADWWKQFYALSDNGVAHEEYSQLYAPNAKLIMGDNEVNGRDEIVTLRRQMWEKVSTRKHTYEIFTSTERENAFMLAGKVKYGFKAGGEGVVDWTAKAEFTDLDGKRLLSLYQVYLHVQK